jgi:hypothetical protein
MSEQIQHTTYAQMCRDDHVEIGHNDSSQERCPVCRERDRADSAESVQVELVAACQAALSQLREYGVNPYMGAEYAVNGVEPHLQDLIRDAIKKAKGESQ